MYVHVNRRSLATIIVNLGLLLLCGLLRPELLLGQTNQPSGPVYPSNRYLLIVETSHAMQSRAAAMVRTVEGVLNSSLAGQARRGDTLGVWVFNDELYTGLLPLQQWAPENQKSIVDHVVSFLRARTFEKQGRWESVIPTLVRVVRNSSFITVILVCTGDEEVQGTPFDDRINSFFQNWRQQQLEARTPFVIALRAQAGRFVDSSMNPAPWPVQLPPLPKDLFLALPAAHAQAPPQKKVVEVPPLIIIGKKHQSLPTATNNVEKPQAVAALTSNPPPQASLAQQSNNAPQPAQNAGSGDVSQSASVVAQSTSAPPGSPVLNAAQLAQSAPASSSIPVATRGATVGEAATQSGTDTKASANAPSFTHPEPAAAALATGSPRTNSNSSLPAARPEVSAAVDLATIQAKRRASPVILCLAGFGLVGLSLAVVWVWRRRARSAGEISIITESIDRQNR